MILQWLPLITFWLSYVAISFAAVITIADFAQRTVQRKPPPDINQESVKLHISGGLLEVNRLPDAQEEVEREKH